MGAAVIDPAQSRAELRRDARRFTAWLVLGVALVAGAGGAAGWWIGSHSPPPVLVVRVVAG